MHDIVPRFEARRPTVCVYSLIVTRLADGFLGVKHGVAAFVIQFLECYFNNNAATCCYQVDRVLSVVRDSTELELGSQEFQARVLDEKKKNISYLVWLFI